MESPFDSSDSAAVKKAGRRSVLGAGGLVCEIGDACQSKFILQGRGVCVHLAADDRNAAVAQPPFAHKRGDAAGYGLALGVNTCGRRDKKARVLRRFRRAESPGIG